MPRLRSTTTGVVVNVDDATAATLTGYEPADDAGTPARKSPARKTAKDAGSSE